MLYDIFGMGGRISGTQDATGMVDIHTHILPGLDDGAADWDSAVQMARGAAADGIHAVVATPHVNDSRSQPTSELILQKTAQFQERLNQAGIRLRVYPGAEIQLSNDLPDRLRAGDILTIANNGRYLLVEFPVGQLPLYTDNVLFQLQAEGVTPIIAHPERNRIIQNDPGRLAGMIHRGCLAQVTGGSLLGNFGYSAESCACLLVRQGMVQVVASDGHSTSQRSIRLAGARNVIAKLVGDREARAMSVLLPNRIISEATERNPAHPTTSAVFDTMA